MAEELYKILIGPAPKWIRRRPRRWSGRWMGFCATFLWLRFFADGKQYLVESLAKV